MPPGNSLFPLLKPVSSSSHFSSFTFAVHKLCAFSGSFPCFLLLRRFPLRSSPTWLCAGWSPARNHWAPHPPAFSYSAQVPFYGAQAVASWGVAKWRDGTGQKSRACPWPVRNGQQRKTRRHIPPAFPSHLPLSGAISPCNPAKESPTCPQNIPLTERGPIWLCCLGRGGQFHPFLCLGPFFLHPQHPGLARPEESGRTSILTASFDF